MNTVMEALARVEHPAADLPAVELEALSLTEKAGRLLPVEAAAKKAIHEKMAGLKLHAERAAFAEQTGFGMIPLDVLKWRQTVRFGVNFLQKRADLPKLMLFPVMQPVTEIVFRRAPGEQSMTDVGYPEELSRLYFDVWESLNKARSSNGTILARTSYTGVIPESVREKVRAAVEAQWFNKPISTGYRENKEHIYLLAETPSWAINEIVEPVLYDPLVVGYRHEALWLIDQFDPTPVERYIALEFTERPALTEGVEAQ